MVTVTKVTRLAWLSKNLLTHLYRHFLDGDHCVCVVPMHVYKYVTEEDGVGKGGGPKDCIMQDLVIYTQIE